MIINRAAILIKITEIVGEKNVLLLLPISTLKIFDIFGSVLGSKYIITYRRLTISDFRSTLVYSVFKYPLHNNFTTLDDVITFRDDKLLLLYYVYNTKTRVHNHTNVLYCVIPCIVTLLTSERTFQILYKYNRKTDTDLSVSFKRYNRQLHKGLFRGCQISQGGGGYVHSMRLSSPKPIVIVLQFRAREKHNQV